MSFLRSVVTVGGWTMGSRILGFIRDIGIAHLFGAGAQSDIFFVALKFPNLFRRLVGEGTINSAFVPLYAKTLAEQGKKAAVGFAREATSLSLLITSLLTAAGALSMPWVLQAFVPGFLDEPAKFAMAVALSQITLPYLIFMGISAILSALLNAEGRFAAAAAAPMLLNLLLIAAMGLILAGLLPVSPTALAYAVTLAGAAQLILLLYACQRAQIHITLPRPQLSPAIRRMLRLMLPSLLGGGLTQINTIIGDLLASFLASGAITYLYYAERVMQLPMGVVGVAVGITLLPLLTRKLRQQDGAGAMHAFNRALEFSLFLALPAATGMIMLAEPIIHTLFERGAFTAQDRLATAGALVAFGAAVPAYILIKCLNPGFYAREDTRTPVQLSAAAILINIAAAILLLPILGHIGVALASAISAWCNMLGASFLLYRRGYLHLDAQNRRTLPRLLLASLAMAGLLWALRPYLAQHGAIGLIALIMAGSGCYGLVGQLTGAFDLKKMATSLKRSNP